MNAKIRWYELLLLSLAALVVLAAGSVQTANADQYIEDSDWYWDTYEDDDEGQEYAEATAYGYPDGTFNCHTEVIANAVGIESTFTQAYAYGWYLEDWTWDGAPGEAPGGTLTWSFSGWGRSHMAGGTFKDYPSDTAVLVSDAESSIWGSGTEGSANGEVEMEASIVNNNMAYGAISDSASPEEDFDAVSYKLELWYGHYELNLNWDMSSSNNETIDSGTTYFYFFSGVWCDCACSANTGATGPRTRAAGLSRSWGDGSASMSFVSN